MKNAGNNLPYKKAQVLPEDPEWRFVWRYFYHDKPHQYRIKRIYCLHERQQQQVFELNLSNQERDAHKFLPTWNEEPRATERAIVIDRWKTSAQIFSPFQSIETDGRRRGWEATKILPLWHGSEEKACHSVAESGFTFFGKTSLGKTTGDPKSTDEGFFGSGIYFTNSARYAGDIYSKGHLLLAWVSMREPFPIVGDPQQEDMQTFKGKGAYKNYNAHYIPVHSKDPQKPYECLYYPCQKQQKPHCDEIVVFDRSQALPRFWVELQVELPYTMNPSEVPQFVEDLIPHLFKILENPEVDKDKKLRNYLGQELGILLKLKGDDYLEDHGNNYEKLYEELTRLLDTQGKVNRNVSHLMTGSTTVPNQVPSINPQPQNIQPLSVIPPKNDDNFLIINNDFEKSQNKFLEHTDNQSIGGASESLSSQLSSLKVNSTKPLSQTDYKTNQKSNSSITASLIPEKIEPAIILEIGKSSETAITNASPKSIQSIKSPTVIDEVIDLSLESLHSAIKRSEIEKVEILISKEPKLLIMCDETGSSPLSIAVSSGELKIVEFLIAKEPKLLTMCDKDGTSPLMQVGKNLEIAELLISKEPKLLTMCRKNGVSPLVVLIYTNLKMVKLVISKEPRLLTMCDSAGCSPLVYAILGGQLDIVEFLTSKEPKLLTICDNNGGSPLMPAIALGKLDMVEFLISKEPKLLTMCEQLTGGSPLMSAIALGKLDMVEFLISKEPKLLKMRNHFGQLPWDIVKALGNHQMIELFRRKGGAHDHNCIVT